MKKSSSILWGVALVAAGIIFALNSLNITNVDVFFKGWWTLFIIVPCAVGLFTERDKTGNIIGLALGVFLLLCSRDVLKYNMLWKLFFPVVIVVIGLKLVFKGLFSGKTEKMIKTINQEGKEVKRGCAVFSGCDINYNGEVFEGADLNAVFGGVECNLKNAIIKTDCVINVCAIFGGVDIIMPNNVNVKVNSNAIFGGIENKARSGGDCPTVYINGTCIFGGVEIK